MTQAKAPLVRLQYQTTNGELGPWQDDAAAQFAARAGHEPDLYDQEGSIFFTFEGKKAQVHDQLLHLIPTLCFEAVTAVLEKGELEFMLNNALTGVRLTRRGDDVEIVSNVFTAVTMPLMPVLEGLVACGESFLRTANALWADDGYDEALAHIAAAGETARKALSAAGMAHQSARAGRTP